MLCCIFVYLLLKKPSDFDFCQSTANLYLTLDYFTEDQKFVYVVTLHVTVLYAWMGIAFIGTESLIMSLFYENAGLFEVIRHRIQNAFSKETLNIPGIKKEKIVQNKLVEAVKLHQRILCNYSHEESVVTFSYFLVLLVGVAITILNLLRLSQLKIEMSTLKILVMEIYLIFICFTYIFLINHLCQTVENNSTKLLFDIYDNLWYLAPVSSQKLLLFMMQKSKKNVLSPVGGIFLPGHEGCIKVTNKISLIAQTFPFHSNY
ncbi:uncharacterized protein LOC117601376 isoform X1 [Osmia lignaria lignaria]|uniref:uncharacterized protein LOC117601376 isoform X1 n=1 Tax=Osmia lignaria lignaria TaxID=1437193 RepID=UPI00402B3772